MMAAGTPREVGGLRATMVVAALPSGPLRIGHASVLSAALPTTEQPPKQPTFLLESPRTELTVRCMAFLRALEGVLVDDRRNRDRYPLRLGSQAASYDAGSAS